MAARKPRRKAAEVVDSSNVEIENAGVVIKQRITDTLEKNYMPYAMSVIVSRAIPEIDGFKPAHRKLLYTMYTMGLINGEKRKSANIVGQTMQLNPHGDGAIYETMVRLTRGNESLLHPYIESKGNFGKAYSKDMAYAASRYTEAKLAPICNELFRDIDKDTVDFVDNFDNTTKEPTLLPATFPSILVNANTGIAVGMASSICSFNLEEVCQAAIGLLRDPDYRVTDAIKAPDFAGGGQIIYDEAVFNRVFETGRGSIRVRSNYRYEKEGNCIEVTQIPPTTTIEGIMDKVEELVKAGKIREITDIRNETGLAGLKITIYLKRGQDPDKLMQRLYKMTPLEDTFPCNFNILIGGSPRVMGVQEILTEWCAFRRECVKRRVYFDLTKKKDKLHLLLGLKKILLDIDKAVKIVRETEEENEVIPNLMIGFGIDETQAEYVAEIKLRNLNKEHILRRVAETDALEKEIEELEGILGSDKKIGGLIIEELRQVIKKYGQPRRSPVLYSVEEYSLEEESEAEDYPVNLFFTKEGYFKKITPQSLRMSGEQKLKDGDEVTLQVESTNLAHLLFFTDRHQVYKSRASEFDDTKASVLGEYIPVRLGMEEDEKAIFMAVTTDYKGYLLFFFENGKVAKVDLAAFETKTNRKKLTGAYSDKSPLVQLFCENGPKEFLLRSSADRALLLNSEVIATKSTRSTQGVAVLTLKKKAVLSSVQEFSEGMLENAHRYRTKTLPSTGSLLKEEDLYDQLQL